MTIFDNGQGHIQALAPDGGEDSPSQGALSNNTGFVDLKPENSGKFPVMLTAMWTHRQYLARRTGGLYLLMHYFKELTTRETARSSLFGIILFFSAVEANAEKSVGVGFDDAVATLVEILEATRGKPAHRQLTYKHKGSVRIVGSVQKQSPGAKADFEVWVGGKPVWKRAFAADDSIRHGFDIVTHEPGPDPAVEMLASTGSSANPLKLKVRLQIIPEPFVTRWREDLPHGYSTWSENERVVLRQQGQEVLQKIRDASAEKRRTIVIPPGDYLFHANWSHASTLRNLADLEIIAEGVTFWFEPPMVHALLFERCRNVTLRGLTIDFTIPCWFQAKVTGIDRETKTVRAVLMTDYPPRNPGGEIEKEGNRAFMFYDSKGGFINHRHTPTDWHLEDDGQTLVCKPGRYGIPQALKAGDHVVGTIRTGAALRSIHCKLMRFEDINIWSSPGMAVYEGGGEGGNVYRTVRATRRPHTNRLQAFGADIFHLADTDRGPVLDRCEMAYGADDSLNIHGSFGRVIRKSGGRSYYLDGEYEAGDTVEFRDHRSVELLGIAKVRSVQAIKDGPSVAINEKYEAKGKYLVELDQTLELPPLSLVVMDGKRSAEGFVLRNCWIHDNFQRTLINGSPNGLIENNTFQNVGMGICITFETWGPWMEGPFARNLTIRHNRFIDAPPYGSVISAGMHPGGGRNRFDAKPVTNLRILDNDFARTTSPPLNIRNVDGLIIRGNSVDYPASAPAANAQARDSTANWIELQDCDHVSTGDNQTPGAKEKLKHDDP